MITFDSSKCIRCGICSEVCPVQIIDQEGDTLPSISEELYSMCRRCGHCEVYCPTGAVSSGYDGIYPDMRADLPHFLEPQEIRDHLISRRTCRVFSERPVERKTLEDILGTVRYAPSGSNRQPVRWIILEGREKVAQVTCKVAEWMARIAEKDPENPMASFFGKAARAYQEGNDPITRKAPNIILSIVPADNPWAQADSIIALSWFELLCQSYGIGTCWLGLVRMPAREDPSILDHLYIPEGYELGFTMGFGYSKYSIRSIPKRNKPDITWI